MIHQDQVEVEKVNAKNAVEEFIYEMKDKADTTLAEFMSEEVSNERGVWGLIAVQRGEGPG